MAYQPRGPSRRGQLPQYGDGRLHNSLELQGRSPWSSDLKSYHASPTDMNNPFGVDGDETESESESSPRLEHSPLTGSQKLRIDDKNATYVVIFPRQQNECGTGGSINPHNKIENPKAAWEKIFKQCKKHEIPHEIKHCRYMEEGKYQELVRNRFKEVLQSSGMRGETEVSVDKDEVFLKISLDRNGRVIKEIAKSFHYRMPFRRRCYENLPSIGTFAGGRVMVNGEGQEVYAYQEYNDESLKYLQPFRRIDEIRLILMQLGSYVSLHDMVAQNVITRHFPGADYDYVMKLHAQWADWQNMFQIPSLDSENDIRGYFGEEIALFFRWIGMYARMLGFLSVVSMICLMRYIPDLSLGMAAQDGAKITFGFMTLLWEAYFQKESKASSARAVQAWGMDGFEYEGADLSSFNPALEGTQTLKIRKTVGAVALIFYMGFFMFVVYKMNWTFAQNAKHGDNNYAWFQSYLQTFLIRVLSFVWRKIAYVLVMMQNHRTKSQFDNALIINLSVVKIFVALWPFFYTAIVKFATETTCGEDLSAVAKIVYQHSRWPVESPTMPQVSSDEYIPIAELHFLQEYSFITHKNRTCIAGCYPVECNWEKPTFGESGLKQLHCTSNCMQSLQDSLRALYVTQVLSCMVYILIPVVLVRVRVWQEMRKAEKLAGRGGPMYSFLQLQAKCHKEAPYEFQCWGGSHVEDFLEMAVTYALQVCFGICSPSMAIIGFICMLIQYRLLAYRMTILTCRPEPRGSAGIGLVGDIFEVISYLAVVFNVLLTVVLMLPLRTFQLYWRILFFVMGEKLMLLLRSVIGYMVPSIPAEVRVIEDYNNALKSVYLKRSLPEAEQIKEYRDLDIHFRSRGGRDAGQLSSDSEGTE